jgi:hypothetical protein|tara:strand:+ start:1598 stop:1879 length:282 start_codon:yes stop_codon:yes gene_type:complete
MKIFLTGLILFTCLLVACSDDSSSDCQPGEQAATGDALVETSTDVVTDTVATTDVSEPETTLDTTDVVTTVDTTEPEVDTAAESNPDPDRSEP